MIRAQTFAAFRAVLVFTVLCGLAYPLAVTGFARTVFADNADGSLIRRDGVVVGSELLGQAFTGPRYFHSRPSAANGAVSGPSNLGPTNADFLATVADRVEAYRELNGLGAGTPVPVDAVTASGSGLDPHISVANARLQARRVAEARDLPLRGVLALVDDHTDARPLGFLGQEGVNVLRLNLALDDLDPTQGR